MTPTLRRLLRLWRDEGGAALPLALMALLILGAMSAVLLTIGTSEVQIAANHLGATQAQFMAEAGLEDAFNVFRTTPTLVSTAPTGLTAVPGLAGPGAMLGAYGGYTVQYQASGTNTIMVVATGTATSGSQKVHRATLSNSFVPGDGILTGDDLTIDKNPSILGTCGSVHANGDLTIKETPVIAGTATASGTYDGPPEYGPGEQPPKTIPVINPADFLTAAKSTLPANQVYQMKSNGQVLDGNNDLITTLNDGDSYNGWQYKVGSPPTWDCCEGDADGVDGTYYFEGDATVSKGIEDEEVPWNVTIIATANIQVDKNRRMKPHLKDTLLVAGYDILIKKEFRAEDAPGLIAAHEQIETRKEAKIQGVIIAEDASAISSLVTANIIKKNLEFTYNCGLNPPLPGPLQILAWGL